MTLVKQREMQNMTTEGLSGTQSRQLFTSPDSTQRKIKRVDQRYLECQPGDLRLGEIDELLQELRRVVTALDEYGGFNDA
jgi:hypothetical protein